MYSVYLSTNADLSAAVPVAVTANRGVALPYDFDVETTYYWKVIGRLPPLPDV